MDYKDKKRFGLAFIKGFLYLVCIIYICTNYWIWCNITFNKTWPFSKALDYYLFIYLILVWYLLLGRFRLHIIFNCLLLKFIFVYFSLFFDFIRSSWKISMMNSRNLILLSKSNFNLIVLNLAMSFC